LVAEEEDVVVVVEVVVEEEEEEEEEEERKEEGGAQCRLRRFNQEPTNERSVGGWSGSLAHSLTHSLTHSLSTTHGLCCYVFRLLVHISKDKQVGIVCMYNYTMRMCVITTASRS
jgi:hypothetical protein